MVQSAEMEPWIWRAGSKVIPGILTVGGVGVPSTELFKGQLYTLPRESASDT